MLFYGPVVFVPPSFGKYLHKDTSAMKSIDITRLLFNLITGLVCSRFSSDVQLQQSLSKPEKVLIPMSNTSLIFPWESS